MPPLRVLIAGGGTGGHLFPAIAIRQAIASRSPDAEVVFVGTRAGLEARVLAKAGERLTTLWISGISRSRPLQNILLPLKLLVSAIQSLALLASLRPNVAIGTGGYVMGPVLWLAQRLGIPTVLQEQNSFPGLTTKRLARRAAAVCVGFEDAVSRIPGANVIHTGNPLRLTFQTRTRGEAAASWGLDPERRTLLVVGGSAGARSINEAIGVALRDLLEDYNLIWQTGRTGIPPGVARMLVRDHVDAHHLVVREFIEDMPGAYAMAELAVCRAGAMTLAELAAAGVPALLIPYPYATDDHQTVNASSVAATGAAIVLPDHELSLEVVVNNIRTILSSPERIRRMSEAMKSLARPNAAFEVADIALRAAKRTA